MTIFWWQYLMTLRQFLTIGKTVLETWHLRHWLQFWQLRTWIQSIILTWQLIVTLDSIRNSCDVYNRTSGALCQKTPKLRKEHRRTSASGMETQDSSCVHLYSPGYRYRINDGLYGAADIGGRYGLVLGPIRVLSARQARAVAVVFTPWSSGQPIGWRCMHHTHMHQDQGS